MAMTPNNIVILSKGKRTAGVSTPTKLKLISHLAAEVRALAHDVVGPLPKLRQISHAPVCVTQREIRYPTIKVQNKQVVRSLPRRTIK